MCVGVSILDDKDLVCKLDAISNNTHSITLMPTINEIFNKTNLSLDDIAYMKENFVCGNGKNNNGNFTFSENKENCFFINSDFELSLRVSSSDPNFTINNIWTLAIAAIVLTVIDYLVVKFTGLHASPFGKGFVGFALAAITLYAIQFFVAGYSISWMAAIIGALIYGVVDYFLPGNQQM